MLRPSTLLSGPRSTELGLISERRSARGFSSVRTLTYVCWRFGNIADDGPGISSTRSARTERFGLFNKLNEKSCEMGSPRAGLLYRKVPVCAIEVCAIEEVTVNESSVAPIMVQEGRRRASEGGYDIALHPAIEQAITAQHAGLFSIGFFGT